MSLSTRAQATLTTDPATAQIFRALSNKFSDSNPNGIIILGVAENSLLANRLTDFYNRSFKLTPYQLTYGDGFTGSVPLRGALAEHLNETLKPIDELKIKPDEVVVAAGVTALLDLVAWGLTDEGDGILLARPAYSGFEPDLWTRSGTKSVFVDLEGEDFFGKAAVGKHQEALDRAEKEGIKVKALILCNPHNPLGKAYVSTIINVEIEFWGLTMGTCSRRRCWMNT